MSIFSRFVKKATTEKTTVAQEPAAIPAIGDTPAVERKQPKTVTAWRTLFHPLVSEKASHLGMHNQYVFVVAPTTTKGAVRRAIAETYGVVPVRVNIVRMRGKKVRYGRSSGVKKTWKKAIVTLPKGKKIQVYEGV